MDGRISASTLLRAVALACLFSVLLAGLGSRVCLAVVTDDDRLYSGLSDQAYDALTNSTFQSTVEHKKGLLVLSQQLSLRIALADWRFFSDVSLSTDKDPRATFRGVREFNNGQVDIGDLTESTPFSLVTSRSGVAGLRTRVKASLLTNTYRLDQPWFMPRVGSPYARLNWLIGEYQEQYFGAGWLYEPRCSIGMIVPGLYNELLLCTLHQLPGNYGSVQTSTRFGGDQAAERFAYQLKLRVDTALGTTNLEVGRVPLDFSGFVAGRGERYHGWTQRKASHSRRYPFELRVSWSDEQRDAITYLGRPEELLTVTSVEVGTPDYTRVDVNVTVGTRDFVNVKDGSGTEFSASTAAAVDYLWDYDQCRASATVQYRDGESASLSGYPGGRGWFEKAQTQWVASGSFGISTFFGKLTFSARHQDTYTTRLDETNLRFTSYATLTQQLTAKWDCIPIEPWTAVGVEMGLKRYSRVIRSCTGGRPSDPAASNLSHSLEAYQAVTSTVSSTVALPSERSSRTLTLTGAVELRLNHGSDRIAPTFAGKVVYRVKL